MFYFLCEIIIFFDLNNERDDIYKVLIYNLISFMKLLILTTWRQSTIIAHNNFIVHSTIKIHLLTNQNACTIQIIL